MSARYLAIHQSQCGRTRRVGIAVASLVVFVMCGNCLGQTFWTDGTGNWNTAANWSLGVPNSASGTAFDAVIENGGTAQLLAPPDGSVRRLRIGRAAGTGNLLVDASNLTVNDSLYINENGAGPSSVTVRNGSTVSTPVTSVGQSSTASSTFTISGPLTNYNVGSQFIVGNAGAGTASLMVNNGAVLSGGSGLMAVAPGSTANATVQNPGSIWRASSLIVGGSGAGVLNVLDQGEVDAGSGLAINGTSTVNLNGGTLRFATANGLNRLAYGSGTIQLVGDRDLSSDSTVHAIFGTNPIIPSGKTLALEGVPVLDGANVTVNGGTLASQQGLSMTGLSASGFLQVTGGGKVTVANGCEVGNGSQMTVSGAGSKVTINLNLFLNNIDNDAGTLTISNQGTVYVGGYLEVPSSAHLSLNGGTLRFSTYLQDLGAVVSYTAGVIQLSGDRTTGTDAAISDFFGAVPVIPAGKSLVIEGAATIAPSSPLTTAGGNFTASTLLIPFGARLTSITASTVTGPIVAAAGSLIDATSGDLSIGDSTKVNGFYSNGTIDIGSHTVTLSDSNDAVFDSGALVALGSGANPGTLNSANGLTLDFGGNITGTGAIITPNTIAKPLINNGHITGNSATQRVTLSGYVKGVGTFDNVDFTGTFSPGLSPTILSAGNVGLSSTSTLVMELGGTSPGTGYDQLQSSGALTLGGTLQVSLIHGFSPAAGESFNLFDWTTMSGSFTTLQLPLLSGLSWNTSQLYTTGVLSVVGPSLQGDFNGDGVVNAADYVLWRKGLGTTYTQNDYDVWRGHFGQTVASGMASLSAIVPEPRPPILLFAAAVGTLVRRNSRQGRRSRIIVLQGPLGDLKDIRRD